MLRKALFILSVSAISLAFIFQQEGDFTEVGVAAGQPKYQVQAYSTLHEVRVVDGDGHLVKRLREDSFLVLESGRHRPIDYFEELDMSPVSLGILVDIGSNSDEKQILVAKAAVFGLIHQLQPIDELLIGVYDEDVHFISDLTRERLELLRALENVSPGGRINVFSKLTRAFASSAHTGWAVDKTLMRMRDCYHSNKALLVFSAAFGSIGPATREHLLLAGTKLFAVTWKNRVGDALNFWGDKTASKKVIRGSGGIAFLGQTILERIETLRDSLKSFYLIAYEPLDRDIEEDEPDLEFRTPEYPDYQIHAVRRVAPDHPFY